MKKFLILGIPLLVFLTLGFIAYNKTDKLKLGQVHKKEQEDTNTQVLTPTSSSTPTSTLIEKNPIKSALKENEETKDDDSNNFWKPTENQNNTQQTLSYVYDSYYPIILSLSDNKGSITKNSQYNQYPPGTSITGTTLKVGDTVHWKAEASDPSNRQIFYNFHSNSQRFTDLFGRENGQFKYTTVNEIEFTITDGDINEVGESLTIVLYIKSDKENYRTGANGHDDSTYLDYKLSR